MANTRQIHLTRTKKGKNDEFYTQWSDIEKESNFFKFFVTKFNEFGIKKLVATSYAPSPIVNTQLSLLANLVPEKPLNKIYQQKQAYKIELSEIIDEDGTGQVNIDDVILRLNKEKKQ